MDTSTADPGPPVRDRHTRLLTDAQPYCLRHALALAGPDALRLHGLPVRVHGADLLLVTAEGPPLGDLAAGLAETLRAAGHRTEAAPGTARRHQLAVVDGESRVGIELRREPLTRPPVLPEDAPVPVAALEDAAALAVLTLCERALPAELFTVHALTARLREGQLLALAAAFDEEFTAATLADRLESAAAPLPSGADDTRQWAENWAQDLRLDLLETTELADGLHDPYLDDADPDGASDDL
ncbi:hypothetical protein [Kitasatospora cheerisanensis]|uniref:Uncharacterized protein n=1 Tax=Kitasatospora cheerisanensis KCTC 2395 TaxID=1348663 RepID=A0A066YT00_9ACTN|nr:hypothetical protein [Kitasatospora cheerisanensis]KDN83119.1 hypothetical protein KCH_52650 [Kitasatospora cheerisanensis KCTC 2395]